MRRIAVIAIAIHFGLSFSAFGQNPLLDELLPKEVGRKSIFYPEGKGFRMESPKPSLTWLFQQPNTLWSNTASYALGGNFEFSARYDVSAMGVKGEPITHEGNAELSLDARGRTGLLGINIGVRPDKKECFNILRYHHNPNGSHYNIITLPRKSNVGRIFMRREGDEITFEIADGPNAPLIEIVRYPFSATLSPNPRISIYQGNGRFPVPVNVLFDDVTLKADQILRGVEAKAAPPTLVPPKEYPIQIDYSNNPAGILADFRHTNDSAKAFRLDGNVIRVQPPVAPTFKKGDPTYHYHDSWFSFTGDFECSFRYEVAQLGPIGPDGYGSCTVGMTLETESPIGSFSFGRGLDRRGGHRYSITRYSPTSLGGSWDTQAFPTRANTGRIILRRTGKDLVFLVQEGDSNKEVELTRQPFVSTPIKRLRLLVDQGNNGTNPINVAISELSVKAGRIDEPEKILIPLPSPSKTTEAKTTIEEPVVLEAAPRPPSRSGLYIGILIGGGVLVLLAVLIGVKRRRAAKG